MKREFLLKGVLSICIMLGSVLAFGQAKDAGLTQDQTVADTITASSTMPYYVEPDSYFNPNYNGAGGWLVTSDFLWTFDGGILTGAVDGSATTSPIFDDNTIIDPEVTFDDTEADYTLAVRESSTDGCDGTIRLLNITTIAAPSVDFTTLYTTVGNDTVEQCGAYGPLDVDIDIAGGKDTYLVDYNLLVEELSADQSAVLATVSDTDNTDVAFSASGTLDAGVNFTVSNNRVTRYTYTLEGINDRISRKSDYLSGPPPYTEFTGTDLVFVVIVKPAPTTGPIYHVPNL